MELGPIAVSAGVIADPKLLLFLGRPGSTGGTVFADFIGPETLDRIRTDLFIGPCRNKVLTDLFPISVSPFVIAPHKLLMFLGRPQ
eukprot:CAMPEP_0170962734 /NCGR_PEP_ID=MMETSP0735-20130129/39078_1 /TAXON_ID=186038 /ORGANISM="Fragilariopsis kerguelensis, Strain L26-C5" /LENGTH=85 /DNA_ID=CAMNT_0011379107 /DNA_START=12 /DNA_END=266 /DNA_ORIENTATION=-